MKASAAPFGRFEETEVDLHTLENDHGMTMNMVTYGGTVTDIIVPDREGKRSSIVCGFGTLERYFSDDYKSNSPYFGCLVGRYAARIKDGKFSVGGAEYQVATNNGPNHLHGGYRGFGKRLWTVDDVSTTSDAATLTLSLFSPDGEESYPGNLQVKVAYRLTNGNELQINYKAATDKETPLSLTNHSYFNLNGFSDTILDHTLQLDGDRYLVPDETNVPVDHEASVADTVCDFNQAKRIGDAFNTLPMGFEHYYVFRKPVGTFGKVATVVDTTSGRSLEVSTSEPGALFYTGRYTSDKLRRESGEQFGQFRGLCVETSKYPNGPNIPGAPNSILHPEQQYDETQLINLAGSQVSNRNSTRSQIERLI